MSSFMVDNIVKKFYNCHDRDLSRVGFFLANRNDVSALKLLRIMVFSAKYGAVRKTIDVNKKFLVKGQDFNGIVIEHRENIASSLVNNPLYISRDVLSEISKIVCVDFSFKPYGDETFSLSEQLGRIVYDIDDERSKFYKRTDLVVKNLNILRYFVKKGVIPFDSEDYCFENIEMIINTAMEKGFPEPVLNSLMNVLNASKNMSLESYNDLVKRNLSSRKWSSIKQYLNDDICHAEYEYMNEILIPFMKQLKK